MLFVGVRNGKKCGRGHIIKMPPPPRKGMGRPANAKTGVNGGWLAPERGKREGGAEKLQKSLKQPRWMFHKIGLQREPHFSKFRIERPLIEF